MAQKLLHGSDVGAVFEQMRGEGVSESMAGDPLGNAGADARLLHRALEARRMYVMAHPPSRAGIMRQVRSRKDPLPAPLAPRPRVLPLQCPRQRHAERARL